MLTCDLGRDRHLRAFEEADAERLHAAVEANRDYLTGYAAVRLVDSVGAPASVW